VFYRLFYANVVKDLDSCLESVNLDYFQPLNEYLQIDQKTLFQNSSGVTYANTDYSETAIGEIVKNNGIRADLFVVGKPLPYMGHTNPDDLSCWSDDVPYISGETNQSIAGFATWPFATQTHQITAIDWAKDVKHCGEGPVTEIPDITTSSSYKILFSLFMFFILCFIQ